MKRLAIAVVSATAACSGAAAQEDVGYWRGLYVGVHVGGIFSQPHYRELAYDNYDRNPTISGVGGGVLAGHNWQSGAMVFGLEADFAGLSAEQGNDVGAPFNDYTAFQYNWNAHVRGRAGYVFDNVLLFVAGGLAIAEFQVDDTDPGWDEKTSVLVGWSVGGGMEFMLGDNMTARLEYLYDDYGSDSHVFSEANNGDLPYPTSWQPTANIVRAAVNWRF
ncbi:MAG: outer membrane beta-barrel protein [Pseudomonadota bacterium]